MSVDTLKSAAQKAQNVASDAANAIFNNVIKNIGKGLQYVGKMLWDLIQKIGSFVVVFFKEYIPLYFNILKEWTIIGLHHFKNFSINVFEFLKNYSIIAFDYIRNNKLPISVGAGIGVLAAVAVYNINQCLSTEE